jgi:hypothetical protein
MADASDMATALKMSQGNAGAAEGGGDESGRKSKTARLAVP